MPSAPQLDPATRPSLAEATRVWLSIGLLSFGGPAGQIALMHRILVEERRWLPENRFLHALNFCMLLPGPEAQQLATYAGWLLHGWRGGVIAGTLFVLPGFLVILGLSATYALASDTAFVPAIFFGLKAAVLAIVVEALLRIGRRAIRGPFELSLAALAFLALFAFAIPFPVVVLAAAAAGLARSRIAPAASPDVSNATPDLAQGGGWRQSLGAILVWGGLWTLPFLVLVALGAAEGVYMTIAVFFSQMAMVTFGGAYAVLAYVAQEAVMTHGWLRPGEMLDGLALAETTPGPLVLVLNHVGFLAAFRNPGGLEPLQAGILGASLTAWVTFVPCFLWILAGAPHIERLRGNRALGGALSAITAAVVGVILNLALWFGIHVLFAEVWQFRAGPLQPVLPRWQSLDPIALLLSAVAALLLFRFRWGVIPLLGLMAGLGLALAYLLPMANAWPPF